MRLIEHAYRSYLAEFLGTALLLATVVGSGIMAQQLSHDNVGVALLANALATGAALYALIVTFGSISGAHFNPVVTLSEAAMRRFSWVRTPGYVVAQLAGALAGVMAAHAMFGLDLVQRSSHERSGGSQMFSEIVATFGLVLVIGATSRRQPKATPAAVALYIIAAYWFTASTSFANPAVTVARAMTDTFAGIRPTDVAPFIAGQLAGATLASIAVAILFPTDQPNRPVM